MNEDESAESESYVLVSFTLAAQAVGLAWFAKVVHPEILDADRREFFTFAHSVVTNAQRQSNRGNEMCDNEMSRDHDAPVEYCENSLR